MRCAFALFALCLYGSVQGQISTSASIAPVQKIDGLTPDQQKAVDDYVRQGERPTGEVRILANLNIAVRSSEALRTLFPKYKFVAVTWMYEADAPAFQKNSIPGPITQILVLDENGKSRMPKHTGYLDEYADLLCAERIKVTDEASAALVRSALTDIGIGMSSTDLRHGNSDCSWDTESGHFAPFHRTRKCAKRLITLFGWTPRARSSMDIWSTRSWSGESSRKTGTVIDWRKISLASDGAFFSLGWLIAGAKWRCDRH